MNDPQNGTRRSSAGRRRQSFITSVIKRDSATPELLDHIDDEVKKLQKSKLVKNQGKSWTNLISYDDQWNEDGTASSNRYNKFLRGLMQFFHVFFHHKDIYITSIATFLVLSVVGLSILLTNARNYENDRINEAYYVAQRAENLLQLEIEKSFRPLYTMSSFIQELDTFDSLPTLVNSTPLLEPTSLPFPTHRNVTSICDNETFVKPFDEIAASIKQGAQMQKILVSIQLAPHSIVCLVHPLVNTEDFDNGLYLNNTGAIGHDLLTDPRRAPAAIKTIKSEGVVVAGPLTLIQGGTPVVTEAFIVRLNVVKEGYQIQIDDSYYPGWGLAVVILNWAALRDQIGLYDLFSVHHMEFNITRLDTVLDTTTNEYYTKVVPIAASKNAHVLSEENSVSIPIHLTFNEWTMVVGYESGFSPVYLGWGCFLVLLSSSLISLMLSITLVSKQIQKTLLYKTMPKRIVKKLEKGKTVVESYNLATAFYSDIVGFTKLSGSMTPMDVMMMLNEMYCHFDELVEKHQICKVETIGDAYICIGGGPDKALGREGAERVALFALDAMKFVQALKTKSGLSVQIRAGVASGPMVACVIGNTVPKLTLFGSTCELAEHLESSSEVMKIQCSDVTQRLLRDSLNFEFNLQERYTQEDLQLKRGLVQTFFVLNANERKHNTPSSDQNNIKEVHENDQADEEMLGDFSELTNFSHDHFKANEPTNNHTVPAAHDNGTNENFEDFSEIELNNAAMALMNKVKPVFNEDEKNVAKRRASFNSDKGSARVKEGGAKRGRRMSLNIITRRNSNDSEFGMSSDDNGRRRSSVAGFGRYMTALARGGAIDSQSSTSGEEEEGFAFLSKVKAKKAMQSVQDFSKSTMKTAQANPAIIFLSLGVFIFLCGVSLTAVFISARNYEDSQIAFAYAFAEDVSNTIVRELGKALLPLYTLSEFVMQLDGFDSLPLVLNTSSRVNEKFLSVSSTCTDEAYVESFNDIAATIKADSDMNETLLVLQLSPSAIVCLSYPLVVNLDDDKTLNNTNIIGYDILNDPNTSPFVSSSILSGEVYIEGPKQLIQGAERILIGRLAIPKNGFSIEHEEKSYPFWGFSTILLNWNEIINEMDLYGLFLSENMEFRIKKYVPVYDAESKEYTDEELIVAQSDKSATLNDGNSIQNEIRFSYDNWLMTAGFEKGFSPPWKVSACVGSVLVSLIFSTFFFLLMVSKFEQKELLGKMLPKHVIERLKEGETVIERYSSATIYFSHIVDFSNMGLAATEVMEMLNEIYDGFDEIAKKCEVQKIETIGDAYIVVGGGPDGRSSVEGAENVAYFALECMKFVQGYTKKEVGIRIRSGLLSGPIVAGVIGTKMPKYTIYGDTVNFASRMESTGKAMHVQCNDGTKDMLEQGTKFKFKFEQRIENGKAGVFCKGKGIVDTYWIREVSCR